MFSKNAMENDQLATNKEAVSIVRIKQYIFMGKNEKYSMNTSIIISIIYLICACHFVFFAEHINIPFCNRLLRFT